MFTRARAGKNVRFLWTVRTIGDEGVNIRAIILPTKYGTLMRLSLSFSLARVGLYAVKHGWLEAGTYRVARSCKAKLISHAKVDQSEN